MTQITVKNKTKLCFDWRRKGTRREEHAPLSARQETRSVASSNFVPWGPFLESPGNLPGPKSVFGDKCFSTEVHFLSFE